MLLDVGEEVSGSLDFDVRGQLLAQASDLVNQVASTLDTVEGTGIHAPVLVDVEVSRGGHQRGVVLGGLNVGLAGIEHLPLDQGSKKTSVKDWISHSPPPP